MAEEIVSQVLRLASSAGLGLPIVLALVVACAILLVLLRRAGALRWNPPPVPPDPTESNLSPPMPLHPDGSIPVSNPTIPPEVIT